jgi:hypothetical protein
MSAAAILDDLHRRGVRLWIKGEKLRWRAPEGVVTAADLSALREHKAEAMAIIREQDADRIEERAGIIEFDAHLSRREAERRARNEQQSDGGDAA